MVHSALARHRTVDNVTIFFLTLVCQVLFFLGDARARARVLARTRGRRATPLPLSSPAALLLLASGLESWPDSRLALAGGSWLRSVA